MKISLDKVPLDAPRQKSPGPSASGVARVGRALRCSIAGLRAVWRYEAAFRQEIVAGAVLVPLAFWLPVSFDRSLLLVAALVPVLVVELLNSAIEALADAVSQEWHPLIGRAKDIGSAAVLLSLVGAATVWAAILL